MNGRKGFFFEEAPCGSTGFFTELHGGYIGDLKNGYRTREEGGKMPDVKIYGPKIGDLGTKRVLVKEITDALEKAYKLPRRSYVVTIFENMPENVGIGGVLNIDEKPST